MRRSSPLQLRHSIPLSPQKAKTDPPTATQRQEKVDSKEQAPKPFKVQTQVLSLQSPTTPSLPKGMEKA